MPKRITEIYLPGASRLPIALDRICPLIPPHNPLGSGQDIINTALWTERVANGQTGYQNPFDFHISLASLHELLIIHSGLSLTESTNILGINLQQLLHDQDPEILGIYQRIAEQYNLPENELLVELRQKAMIRDWPQSQTPFADLAEIIRLDDTEPTIQSLLQHVIKLTRDGTIDFTGISHFLFTIEKSWYRQSPLTSLIINEVSQLFQELNPLTDPFKADNLLMTGAKHDFDQKTVSNFARRVAECHSISTNNEEKDQLALSLVSYCTDLGDLSTAMAWAKTISHPTPLSMTAIDLMLAGAHLDNPYWVSETFENLMIPCIANEHGVKKSSLTPSSVKLDKTIWLGRCLFGATAAEEIYLPEDLTTAIEGGLLDKQLGLSIIGHLTKNPSGRKYYRLFEDRLRIIIPQQITKIIEDNSGLEAVILSNNLLAISLLQIN